MLRLIAFLLALLPAAALAQGGSVRQSGTVTPGHVACWVISGVVEDCGTATNGAATAFGMTGSGSNTPQCWTTQPISGPFNQLCVVFTTSGFVINDMAYAGATHIPWFLCVNGFCGIEIDDTNAVLAETIFTGNVPLVTAGSGDCGTSPAIVGTDNVFRVTVGSSANGGLCTVTFAQVFPHTPICYAVDETSSARLVLPAPSTINVVLTAVSTFTAGDKIGATCFGYK